jgi:hypothetical protein
VPLPPELCVPPEEEGDALLDEPAAPAHPPRVAATNQRAARTIDGRNLRTGASSGRPQMCPPVTLVFHRKGFQDYWPEVQTEAGRAASTAPRSAYADGENTQVKGRMRRSFVLATLPVQPQEGLTQASFSFPNSFMASRGDREPLEHFRCRLMLWPPLGHSNTSWYALLIEPL